MDISVTDLQAHLDDWLERARRGEEIMVMDEDTMPMVRILPVPGWPVPLED